MRTLRPAGNIYAFYEGRGEGERFAEGPNWVDEEIDLGIASYAVVDGERALIHDTHLSVSHARRIRLELEQAGVREFTVLLSHWHLDHVAGTEAFSDCEVIACARTAEMLGEHKAAIESGEDAGLPAIDPLILPTRTFGSELRFELGSTELRFIHLNIHSDDAAVVWIPAQRTLLAGDTLEDTITYVDEPESFDHHLADLDRLAGLAPDHILPAHGDPEVIAAGGYPLGLIDATAEYIRTLQRMAGEPELREVPLAELVADAIEAGSLRYHEPYEAIHRQNVARTLRQAGFG